MWFHIPSSLRLISTETDTAESNKAMRLSLCPLTLQMVYSQTRTVNIALCPRPEREWREVHWEMGDGAHPIAEWVLLSISPGLEVFVVAHKIKDIVSIVDIVVGDIILFFSPIKITSPRHHHRLEITVPVD